MKIKTVIEAIDLTIERHQAAIDNHESFTETKKKMKGSDWGFTCPLCEFSGGGEDGCKHCPWTIFKGKTCLRSSEDFNDNEKSIARLKEWKNKLTND